MDAAPLDVMMRDGYVIVPGGVSRRRCAEALAAIDDFRHRNAAVVARNAADAGQMYRVANLHVAIDALLDVFAENGALSVCDEFFDAETALYTSLYFERGSEQELHRDSPLFATRPEGRYLGVWTALEDIDADNGPLVVVPGSHVLPPVDTAAISRSVYGDRPVPARDPAAWNVYQRTTQQMAADAGLAPIEVHVRAGDVIVWHPLALHGGAPHRSPDRTRRSFVMHVTPLGTPVFHQDVFFDPDLEVSETPSWTYARHGGRRYAEFQAVDFGHEYVVPARDLREPERGAVARFKRAARRLRSGGA